jgi:hypothetical protein
LYDRVSDEPPSLTRRSTHQTRSDAGATSGATRVAETGSRQEPRTVARHSERAHIRRGGAIQRGSAPSGPARTSRIAPLGAFGEGTSDSALECPRVTPRLRSRQLKLRVCRYFLRSPLTDSNRRPPPYHEHKEGADSCGFRVVARACAPRS